MKTLAIDIETYSGKDIRESGVYAYADSPDFEILLIGYQLADGPVRVLDLTEWILADDGPSRWEELIELDPDFTAALLSRGVIKTAYNANFERTCLAKYFGVPMPPEEWRCTMVLAATLGLPGNLAGVGAALDLGEDETKASIGKRLIDYFCKPCKPTKTNGGRTRNYPSHDPDKWKLFIEYNRQDVVAETAIREKLSSYPVPQTEQELWSMDQHINDRGILLDMDFADKIICYDGEYQTRLKAEAREITGLANPNSPAQLRPWLADHGCEIPNLRKETVATALSAENLNPEVRRMLEIRQLSAKTSVKKYQAMEQAVCGDGRLRGILQFYGANRTGRWAGRIVQVHNLPQNKLPDIDLARDFAAAGDFDTLEMLFPGIPFVFSQLIRTAFVAPSGCQFIVSDFSAIEARVIAWLAGEEWRLEVFRTHGKIYEASASQMFHVPIDQIKKGSKLRQQGKIAELALGYQGHVGAIKSMDKDGSIPEEEIPMLVENWRRANPHIVKFWKNAEAAAKTSIRERRRVRLKHGLEYSYRDGILFMQLPSGRKIAYYNARIEDTGKESITYSGVDQKSKKWGRLETYGGKLVENIVQATARDCLAVAMLRVTEAGYRIVMHVHDEIICEVPLSDQTAERRITEIMGQSIPWAPDLPLKGDTYCTPYYKKD
ncbi:DNA polymerase [Cuneatibacter sp. NSJ-177]|uniref:DNA polymerase n=1 Tax=Cuneatibacter sp. NSJ-177 TaxID=2931401 RepID=UPI001FD3F079|nr:DNA polymerase [Cuneatibacter sp. NSJ-177]MCJ7834585.1 DNA polymerase [Cuneatibacter sp. NSJ-177]